MPPSSAALRPLAADALKPRPKPQPENAALHPASLHSLAARPAPLAKAHSDQQVLLTPAQAVPDPLPMQPPAFAPKPEPALDDWSALLAVEPEEEDADEPAQDFALYLPTPVPVSLFEELPVPKKKRWPRILLWSAVLLVIAGGMYLSWRMIG